MEQASTLNDGKQCIEISDPLAQVGIILSHVSILEPSTSPAELSFSHSQSKKLDNVLYFRSEENASKG